MNDIEIINLLKENCGNDINLANFLNELFNFELDFKVQWNSDYNKIIEKYYENEDSP